nr:hypothetical protein [Bacteroidota bacterium]
MKKQFLLTACLLLSTLQLTFSQEYHPLLEANKSWDDISCVWCVVCPSSAVRYFNTGTDTTINNQTYMKIGSYNYISSSDFEICPPYYQNSLP